jgi:hypothetical protein
VQGTDNIDQRMGRSHSLRVRFEQPGREIKEATVPERQIKLRCVADGKAGKWEAICLDLDIAVQGASFEEVYRELNAMIATYLETVVTYSPSEQARFLSRRAPLRLRLQFALRYLSSYLFGLDSDTEHHSFTATRVCPV